MFKSLVCGVCGTIAAGMILGVEITPVVLAQQPSVTPLPESQFTPKAQIQLNSDRVNITLVNNTNAVITYQAVGDTQPRVLEGRQTVNLQGLRVPTTLTFRRQDSGLLQVTPIQAATSPNTVEVTLDTTTNLGIDRTTMRVENNGSVFLY